VEPGGDSEITWKFTDDFVEIPPFHFVWHAYQHYERFGSFPDGRPWIDQPLSLLAAFEAIRAAMNAKQRLGEKEDWSKATALEAEIYRYANRLGEYGREN